MLSGRRLSLRYRDIHHLAETFANQRRDLHTATETSTYRALLYSLVSRECLYSIQIYAGYVVQTHVRKMTSSTVTSKTSQNDGNEDGQHKIIAAEMPQLVLAPIDIVEGGHHILDQATGNGAYFSFATLSLN
jgi:hypothetical protein